MGSGSNATGQCTAEPIFSIIVPVYNTERTLPACLDSILAQTFADIEVVCVDDGSPDAAADVLATYASRDPRVRVLRQPNAGLSAARNAGMRAARSRYLVFVDSDDTIEPILCERVLQAFESDVAVDAVTFGATCEPERLASARIRMLLSPADAVYRGFDPALLFSAHAQPYACRVALSASFVRRWGLTFDESLRFAEDVPFLFTVYPLARTTVLISDKLYRYHMQEGSLTHEFNERSSCERKLSQHLDVLRSIFREWEVRGIRPSCAPEMVTWCLDFTLFDIMRASRRCAASSARRLAAVLEHAFGPNWAELPTNSAVRRVARAVAAADEDAPRVSGIGLVRFFVATRGLAACFERVLGR